jgi:hypothetical protein
VSLRIGGSIHPTVLGLIMFHNVRFAYDNIECWPRQNSSLQPDRCERQDKDR